MTTFVHSVFALQRTTFLAASMSLAYKFLTLYILFPNPYIATPYRLHTLKDLLTFCTILHLHLVSGDISIILTSYSRTRLKIIGEGDPPVSNQCLPGPLSL